MTAWGVPFRPSQSRPASQRLPSSPAGDICLKTQHGQVCKKSIAASCEMEGRERALLPGSRGEPVLLLLRSSLWKVFTIGRC